MPGLIRNSQFLTAFLSTSGNNTATAGSCHALSESVFVLSFPV